MIALMLALWATPAHAGCTVIRGGTVHLPDGAQALDVRLVDERIDAVAKGLPKAHQGATCEVVDASGKQVTAGFIEVNSQLGLVEVDLESGTRDADAETDDPIRAALQVADAYNPRSSLIPIQRIDGVTGALVLPSGGRISGQAAHVSLAGASQSEAVQDRSVAVVANLGGASRAQALRELRTALRDARDFKRLKASWERGQVRPLAADGADLEALWPVIDGTVPLVVGADRAADIEALIRLADEEGIRLVIQGAAEGHLLADALADAGIAVIVDAFVYGPGGFTQIHGRADNARLLDEAGVEVILTTNSTHNARNLGQMAGNAVRGGLDPASALAGITATPARVFGLEGRGVIAPGAAADVVVWTGDPLEVRSWPTAVFINGRTIALESRQTHLRDAYRELPGSPREALELP